MWTHLRQLFKNTQTRPLLIKSVGFLVLFGITFYGAYGMAKSYVTVKKETKGKERELETIHSRLDTINSQSAIKSDFQKEKALREKLHMVKPGEDLIIIVPPETREPVKK